MSSGHRRTAFALAENIRLLASRFGVERLGFLTLTFRDHVLCIKEAQRRFNSLRTHVLGERYSASIAVPERMASGRIHFHLIVVVPVDIRTGVNFDAIAKGDYTSAGKWLRSEWAFWRRTAPKFGFGRTELLPVKSTSEGIAKYVGKYIAKHVGARRPDDKGARLVRYSVDARRVGTRFAWAGVTSWLWRAKLAKFAGEQGCRDLGDLRRRFGPRWAYLLAERIAATVLTEYLTGVHALADGHSLPDDVDPRAAREVVLLDSSEWGREVLQIDLPKFNPPPVVESIPSPRYRAAVQLIGDEVRRGWVNEATGEFVTARRGAAPDSGAKKATSPPPG